VILGFHDGEVPALQREPDPSQSGATRSTFESFLDLVPDAVVAIDRHGEIFLANQQVESLLGYRREELTGKSVEMLMPGQFRELHAQHQADYFRRPRTRPMGTTLELLALHKDGTELPVDISLSTVDLGGQTIATAAIRDISERRETERERMLREQLDRARRLESVGQLAGGIAHDFNNTLGVIMNYAEFVAGELEPGSRAHQDVEEIRRAAERAAALTQQLLIFSRRGVAKTEVLYLRDAIAEIENLLRRALGERIELKVSFSDDLWAIEADPGQIEQVLVNLAVNARDAMPEGGRLLIEAENVELDDEYAYMHPKTRLGRYVRLRVSDTGVGMSSETIDQAFEPFYTTKSDGTGLGLATVYGIITGAGGRIDIYSEPGVGTTMKIHLPAVAAKPLDTEPGTQAAPTGRGEVILVVEDEPRVGKMAERILSNAGYSIIGALEPSDALEICSQKDRPIDAMLTDVIMPTMLGTELVEKVRSIRPDLRVIYMSGYSHEVLAPRTLETDRKSTFIEKPFNAQVLLKTVRQLLDGDHGV
jgi:PAS domain S-box-containing protein